MEIKVLCPTPNFEFKFPKTFVFDFDNLQQELLIDLRYTP